MPAKRVASKLQPFVAESLSPSCFVKGSNDERSRKRDDDVDDERCIKLLR